MTALRLDGAGLINNRFFQIGWIDFEILLRARQRQTTLSIDQRET
jgi:hypothetical protein